MSGNRLVPTAAAAAAVALTAAGLPQAAAAQPAPRVQAMVVGRTQVLDGPRTVRATTTRVRVGGRRCKVRAGSPLAVLAALDRAGGPSFRVRDYGSCSSRRTADSSGLYVTRVGRDRASGRRGWVYKVDRRVGTGAAADPSGPFGTGRQIRSGQRVLWFWCGLTSSGACQRTLDVDTAGATPTHVPVRVRAYDDDGRGAPAGGVTATAEWHGAGLPAPMRSELATAPDGTATFDVPVGATHVTLGARGTRVVDAFQEKLALG